jgi:anti-sigma factor RsiW
MPEPRGHNEAEELLPWYATGRLDSDQRILVEQHLSACADCREQLTVERRLIEEFRSLTPEVDAGWNRLRNRIQPHQIPGMRSSHVRTNLRSMVRSPAVAMLAAAQIGFLILGGALLLSLSRPTYHALGAAPPPANADALIIFRGDATQDDVRRALRVANASIVGGPTATDAYLLRLPREQRQKALAGLRADHQVEMAEPIDGTP